MEGLAVEVEVVDSGKVIRRSKILNEPIGCGGSKCAYYLTSRWVLMLSKRDYKSAKMGDNFEVWKKVSEVEVGGAAFASSLGILNPANTKCVVTLSNGVSFDSYISRSFYSLELDGINIVDRKAYYGPLPKPVLRNVDAPLGDPGTYSDLLRPFIDDLLILHANHFYIGGDTFSLAYVNDGVSLISSYTIRMFAFDFQGHRPPAQITNAFFKKPFPISWYRKNINHAIEDVLYRMLAETASKRDARLPREHEGYLDNLTDHYYAILEKRSSERSPVVRRSTDILSVDNTLFALDGQVGGEFLAKQFISVVNKPRNAYYVRELLGYDIDFTYNQGEPLSALVKRYPKLLNMYLKTGALPLFMEDGNRARNIIVAVYRHGDAALMTDIIEHDTDRDKQYSVSYLWVLRRSMLENNNDMALAVANGVGYPADFVAEVLDVDAPLMRDREMDARRDVAKFAGIVERISL